MTENQPKMTRNQQGVQYCLPVICFEKSTRKFTTLDRKDKIDATKYGAIYKLRNAFQSSKPLFLPLVSQKDFFYLNFIGWPPISRP